jgi:hypothetical protein
MRRILTLALVITALACLPAFATNSGELFLNDGIDTATITFTGSTATCTGTCGGLTEIYSPTPGAGLTVIGTFDGIFALNITGQGLPSVNSPTLENLNQINSDNLSSSSETLTVDFEYLGYSVPNALLLGVSSTINSGIASSTVGFTAYDDSSDGLPAILGAGTLIGGFTETGLSSANSGAFATPFTGTASLTEQTVLGYTGNGAIQANFSISQTPEPASVIFLGTAMLGLGALLRKRLQRNNVNA